MKTNVLLISLLCAGVFVSCTKKHNSEQLTIDSDTVGLNQCISIVDTITVDDMECLSETVQTSIEEPLSTGTSHSANNHDYSSENDYSTSYSDYDTEYWEEKRKTSPNDNYLLGFDEDVDDVHDMEIYMEDY